MTTPAEPEAAPDPGRWMRFVGTVTQSVTHVGDWAPDEVKHVAGWLADRLALHGLFVEADPPAADDEPVAAEPEPVKASPRARRNTETTSGGDAPADTSK